MALLLHVTLDNPSTHFSLYYEVVADTFPKMQMNLFSVFLNVLPVKHVVFHSLFIVAVFFFARTQILMHHSLERSIEKDQNSYIKIMVSMSASYAHLQSLDASNSLTLWSFIQPRRLKLCLYILSCTYCKTEFS